MKVRKLSELELRMKVEQEVDEYFHTNILESYDSLSKLRQKRLKECRREMKIKPYFRKIWQLS